MKDEFERLVNRFSREWQDEAKKALNRLYELLQKGKKIDVAVDILQSEYPALFSLPELKPTLVEAACYGYGIAPKVLTAAMFADWEADLSQAWASDNMKLSKRLHTVSLEMRNKIIDTLRTQMKKNAAWIDTARALFDGYNADKVINEQDLPKYLKAVRDATQGSQTQLSAARKAIRNIERLSKTGSTNSLKTAYKQLVKAATTGTEEQLKKACWVAVQEKSRYVAERIARTEMSRAYADGFFRSVADDDDVVAVRWFLGTGHPVFDICDMYMKADMFGLGAGVYPKDKTPPLPAHPFCLCRLSKVYVLDKKPVDQIRKSGDKWLQGLSNVHQNMVLGIDGAEAWRNGEDWRKYMRSWQGFGQAGTRLKDLPKGGKIRPKGVVENALNISKGANIAIEEATTGANPNYHKAYEYKINCQRCVQAYELRRRGYDVIALPKPAQNNLISWGHECFSNTSQNPYVLGQSRTQLIEMFKKADEGSRYSIYIQWKGRNKGAHVFIAEKVNGKMRLVDPQSGKVGVNDYLDQARPNTFGWFRLDDKPLTKDKNIIMATVEGKQP